MRGYPISHRNRFRILQVFCVCVLAIVIIGGCKGSEGLAGDGKKPSTLKEFLHHHEQTFDPSRYELNISRLTREVDGHSSALRAATVFTTVLPETIPGYRVQILFTKDIDQASTLRDSLEEILHNDWVYTEYEPPYYKVRVGN